MTYLAFVLDDSARDRLLSAAQPVFEKVIAHHVTIIFPNNKPAEELMRAAFKDMLGKEIEVEVDRHFIGEDALVQAVGVKVNGSAVRPLGGYYHVTISLDSPAKPVDSNKLFDGRTANVSSLPIKPFRLTGSLQLVD